MRNRFIPFCGARESSLLVFLLSDGRVVQMINVHYLFKVFNESLDYLNFFAARTHGKLLTFVIHKSVGVKIHSIAHY